jgi:small-conductance mechanosensitive channel
MTFGLAAALVRWGIAVTTLLLVLRYWGITAVEVRAVLAYELLGPDPASGRSAITIGRLLTAVLAIVAAWWASRAVRSVLNTRIYPTYSGIDRGAQAAINTMVHYFVMLLGLYVALFAVRVPLGAMTVVLGTVGLGVGLGLQPLFVNFVSGLMILFERHVRVGDIVEVGGQAGEVTNISMRSTSIKTADNIDLILPNSSFITSEVVNWTYHETRIRGRVDVSVAYGTDEQLVKRLLLDIARRSTLVLGYPIPEVWFTAFGESSLDFVLALWFRNTADRGRFMNDVRFEISRVFKEHNIDIPYPHRTLTTAGGKPLPVQVVNIPEAGGRSTAPRADGQPSDPEGPPSESA